MVFFQHRQTNGPIRGDAHGAGELGRIIDLNADKILRTDLLDGEVGARAEVYAAE